MGMNLISDVGEEQWISVSGWTSLLMLAERYNWQPEGTTLNFEQNELVVPWDGGYGSNDGQRVSIEDAGAFANALEQALLDPDPKDEPVDESLAQSLDEVGFLTARIELVPFLQTNREFIAEVVAFCRRGSFIIW